MINLYCPLLLKRQAAACSTSCCFSHRWSKLNSLIWGNEGLDRSGTGLIEEEPSIQLEVVKGSCHLCYNLCLQRKGKVQYNPGAVIHCNDWSCRLSTHKVLLGIVRDLCDCKGYISWEWDISESCMHCGDSGFHVLWVVLCIVEGVKESNCAGLYIWGILMKGKRCPSWSVWEE